MTDYEKGFAAGIEAAAALVGRTVGTISMTVIAKPLAAEIRALAVTPKTEDLAQDLGPDRCATCDHQYPFHTPTCDDRNGPWRSKVRR